MEIFAKRLKGVRKEKKQTQAQMADYLQCSLRAYQYYESATHYPEIPDLLKLADFFGEDMEIFCGDPAYRKKLDLDEREEGLIKSLRQSGSELMTMVETFIKKPPKPLSDEEKKMLDLLAKLNENGVGRLLDTAEDMVAGGRYSL